MSIRARIVSVLLAAATLVVVGQAGVHAQPAQVSGTVASITDGDTLRLTNGARVRLLQIDTPELGTGECYSRAARTALLQRVPVGARVVLEADPRLDPVDRYGRLLRYVHRGTMNVNVALVRAGAAAPYFYGGERGRYAARFLWEATRAKSAKRGLWGACPGTALDSSRAIETVQRVRPLPIAGGGRCDAGYAGGCVPPYPPDLDCAEIKALGIPTPVRVVGPDPHGLDGDGDRLGCER